MSSLRRRELLAGAMLGSIANAAGGYAGKIVDTHVHFYDPGRPQGVPWPPQKDALLYRRTMPEDFRLAAKGLGIDGVIIVEASAWLEDNQWVLDLAKDDTMIKGVVGRLDPGKPDFREHLTRFGKNPLFRGIRLNGTQIKAGLESAAWKEDLQRLADADLQLDAIGPDSMFADLARLSDQIPGLRIVIDHLPFYSPGANQVREMAKRSRIYAKVSGVLRSVDGRVSESSADYREALDEIWSVFGRDRVIYASNWPVSNRMGQYAAVLKVAKEYFSAKGEEAAERFFWKNSVAAYKWKDRG